MGGAFGLLGVALSARASHGSDGPQLAIAAQFLLFHAPVFVALAAIAAQQLAPRLFGAAGSLLGAGLALFSGDLVMRAVLAQQLFPYAAPVGGFLLMAGWLTLLLAGLWLAVRQKR